MEWLFRALTCRGCSFARTHAAALACPRRVARPVFRPRAAALQQHLQGLVFLAAAAAGGCCLGVRDARDVVQNGRPGSSVAPPFAQITEEAPVGVLFVTRASAKESVVRQRMKGNNKGCRME